MKKILLYSILLLSFSATAQSLEGDRLALVALYNSTNGSNWTNKYGWNVPGNVGDNPCGWYGVSCSNNRVSELNLYNNNLAGSIPGELIYLSEIKSLNLNYNKLINGLPVQLGSLAKLEQLSLENNQLAGTIPAEFGYLTKLQVLSLSSNQLSGAIPAQIGLLKELKILRLCYNKFTGNIPAELGELDQLTELQLSGNLLDGEIPDELYNLSMLQSLLIFENNLTGSISPKIERLSSLVDLLLSNNNFSGQLPSEIGNISTLGSVSLFNNNFNGSVPETIGNLTSLQFLGLGNNHFSSLPSTLSNLIKLETLWVGGNDFEGEVPSNIGNIGTLKNIDLSNNKFTGSLPDSFGNLGLLETLIISNNQITSLPLSLSNLTKLYYLLAENNLLYEFPSQLLNLQDFQVLNLSFNQISGAIPAEINNIPLLNYLNLSNNKFSGPVPSLSNISVSAFVGIDNNALNFTGMEENNSKIDLNYYQRILTIQRSGAILSVEAGGTISNNSYTWYKDGSFWKTISGTNSVETTEPGIYYVNVRNNLVSNLVLISEGIAMFNPLPVVLASFFGISKDQGNLLSWSTTSELQNKIFEIERSENAKDFELIGTLDGLGESMVVHSYEFLDVTPKANNYYRLKQIDLDGTYEYSRIIHLNNAKNNLKVYPNPANDKVIVERADQLESIEVYDVNGVKRLDSVHSEIDVKDWKSGIYLFKSGTESRKIIVN